MRVGLDTNVLLRWLFREDISVERSQTSPAISIDPEAEIWISTVVLAEMLWLAAQKFKLDRTEQALMISRLLEHPKVGLAERKSVVFALNHFGAGGAGFVDHLIGALNQSAGCETTLSFDKTASKGPLFTLLA